MSILKKITCKFLESVLRIVPIDNKMILFYSLGMYGDNPKYISEKLHELYPDIIIFWEIKKGANLKDIPDYVRILMPNTFSYCYYLNRCCCIVDAGAGSLYNSKYEIVLKLRRFLFYNSKQYHFSTWHGNPIKTIGADIPEHYFWNEKTFSPSSNTLIADSDYIKDIFNKAFLHKIPILNIGTPRNDILFNTSLTDKSSIKKKLGLPIDKKIILYAPTWRNSIEDSGIIQLREMDIEKLLNTLGSKFGGEWVFVMRLHAIVMREIINKGIISTINDRIIDGNKYAEMAEYLFTTDVLLTDFSGSIYDVALTDKPCFLYAHDLEKYKKDRGFYTPLSFFPYSFANDFESLLSDIMNYDRESSESKRQAFLKKIGSSNDGHASERCVAKILEIVNKK